MSGARKPLSERGGRQQTPRMARRAAPGKAPPERLRGYPHCTLRRSRSLALVSRTVDATLNVRCRIPLRDLYRQLVCSGNASCAWSQVLSNLERSFNLNFTTSFHHLPGPAVAWRILRMVAQWAVRHLYLAQVCLYSVASIVLGPSSSIASPARAGKLAVGTGDLLGNRTDELRAEFGLSGRWSFKVSAAGMGCSAGDG
jgi:hypothetical protein